MGLLTFGSPLSWEETKKLAKKIKVDGVIQFLNLYKKVKDRKNDQLFWGDEIEYTLIKFDHKNKKVFVLLKATEFIEKTNKSNTNNKNTVWHPEYAAYAMEGVPGEPYGHLMGHFNTVEANMQLRRQEITELCLNDDESLLTITAFPRLGCGNFTIPNAPADPKNSVSRSLFFPDLAIQSEHPRFKNLTRNIRERRGKKVIINMPIFKDKNTPSPFIEDLSQYGDDGTSQQYVKPDHVYMDAMGFGMGCGCLQNTFQACCIEEARVLYDQLTPLCPILMALSASTPIMRGYLLDIDCRWDIIAASVDDRTDDELGYDLKNNHQNHDQNGVCNGKKWNKIKKSRYDSVSVYISQDGEDYNDDAELVIDEETYQKLIENGVDKLLAQHIAHLFIRDPLSLFNERIDLDNETETEHFETIQSTNWQSMRFKPPPPNSSIGWRVEFRPMDIQITDFENAAFVTFVVLVTRVILTLKLNLLIPITRVNENMHTAMKRDAVKQEKFYFRKGEYISTRSTPIEAAIVCDRKRSCSESVEKTVLPEACFSQMTVDEIINGGNEFPGLIPLIRQYLQMVNADVDTMCTISQYLSLISQRASGRLLTTASWIRKFVHNHPSYKQDSVISDLITYDLMNLIHKINENEVEVPDLKPNYKTRTMPHLSRATEAGERFLKSKRSSFNTPLSNDI